MNTDKFTGKAQAYANACPGYPKEAVEYICSLAPPDAIFADIGAGTGKFSVELAQRRFFVFAVEPNADMREQLTASLSPFPNIKIVDGTAEATKLPDHSVDVITCAQSLGWFDLNDFRDECCRIGKPGAIVISLYNGTPGDNYTPGSHRLSSRLATDIYFKNPAMREFPNPILYTRERWLQKNASISDNPQPSDPGYDEHITELNEIFDCNNIDGFLRQDLVTVVYSERIEINE